MIVTRDSRIQTRTREIDAVRSHGARMVALVGTEAKTTWAQLEVVMCQWRRIERCLDQSGPALYSATRTTLNSIHLDRPTP